MDKDKTAARKPIILGSARALTKGGPMGNKDETLIPGRYYG